MGARSYADRRKDRIDALADGAVDDAPGVSLIVSAWLRLRRNPVFLLGLAITVSFVVLALISPWIAPHDPAARATRLRELEQTAWATGQSRQARSAAVSPRQLRESSSTAFSSSALDICERPGGHHGQMKHRACR